MTETDRGYSRYILPSLSLVPHDKEVWVRSTYAAAIGPLADCAHSLLVALYAASQVEYDPFFFAMPKLCEVSGSKDVWYFAGSI